MSLYKETERKLKDEYGRVKDYLNDEDSGCEELYLIGKTIFLTSKEAELSS